MTKFLTNIDLAQNQLKNAVIHNLSAAPQNPFDGQIYYNTTDNKFYLFANNIWKAFTSLDEISEKYYNKEQIDEIIETSSALPNQENNSGKTLVTDGSDASWENIIELNNVTQATREGLPKLVINKLTQAEYDALEAAGLINEKEVYLTEGDPSDNPGASLPDQTNNGGKALVTDGTEASWEHIINMNNITESTSGGLASININKLTQAEYDNLLENGQINENELYIITDPKEILSKEEITEQITEEVTEQLSSLTIPTNTSELTNDSGFITEIPSEYITETELDAKGYLTEHQNINHKADLSYVDDMLADKANIVSTYTKDEVDALIENIDVSGDTLPNQENNSGKALVTNGSEASWENIIELNNVTQSTVEGLPKLVINRLTQEEYNELLASGLVKDDEIYITNETGSGSSSSLPDQTDNAGKALVTDGTDAKWDYIVNINNVSTSETAGISSLVINRVTQSEYDEMLANDQIKDNELYTITDADTPTINDIETIIASKQPQSHTITLSSSEWSTQDTTISLRKEVTSLLSTDIVWVSPVATSDSSNETVYVESNIRAVTQEDGFLTFYCDTLPTTDVNIQLIIQHI